MHQQNACLYLAETTWLFTQLWASLQSGEADGGVARQTIICFKAPQLMCKLFIVLACKK